MTSNSPQRIRYFQGQKLVARDLRDTIAYETRMHGMHLRGVHDTWGVALGFEVTVNIDRDLVLIGPGVAYDCHGRAIVSSRVIQVEMPPFPNGQSRKVDQQWVLDLVIAYGDDVSPLVRSSCTGDGPSPTEERPAWRWVIAGTTETVTLELAGGVRLGEEIPLARFIAGGEAGISNPDYSHRRSAQGLVRPHIGSGKQKDSLHFNESLLAFSLHIDTSAAGFTSIPHYFASLDTHPFLSVINEDDPNQVQILRFIQGPFLNIRNALTTGFDLDVRFAFSRGSDLEITKLLADMPSNSAFLSHMSRRGEPVPVPVAVNWFGIEDVGGCIQPLHLIVAFLLPFVQIFPLQMFLMTNE